MLSLRPKQESFYVPDEASQKSKGSLHILINNDPTNIPAIFSGTFSLASEVHSYNTTFVTDFNIYRPSISNNYGARMFSFVASKIWKYIPLELKKLSYNCFCK